MGANARTHTDFQALNLIRIGTDTQDSSQNPVTILIQVYLNWDLEDWTEIQSEMIRLLRAANLGDDQVQFERPEGMLF